MRSRLLTIACLAGGLAVGAWADVAVEKNPNAAAPLTSAVQVLGLSEAEAGRALAVRLQGVVVGEAPPVGKAFVLWDRTGFIYVRDETAGENGTFRRGDLVEVDASSDVGGFTPSLSMKAGRKRGTVSPPEPRAVAVEQLLAGQCDAQWVRVRGIVRRCERSTVWAGRWRLALASGGQVLTVHVNDELSPERLVDAEVCVDALVFNQHNMNRQAVSALLLVPSEVPITIEVAGAADPFAAAVRPVGSLLQFERNGRPGHRVHVRGRIIHQQPGTAFWIRDGDRGLGVLSTQPGELRPGDVVDVAGFPVQGSYNPRLEDAVFRRESAGTASPAAVPADLRAAIAHDSDLVAIEARLVEQRRVSDGVGLVLDWQGTLVAASLAVPEGHAVPGDWIPGSVVRATGICAVPANEPGRASGTWEPRSFELRLRSVADLAVIQSPPWWTPRRVLWGLGLATGGLLLALGGVLLMARRRLHAQAQRRAMAEAEFSAILAERNRVAREIHDTLAQGLAAIAMRLEIAKNVPVAEQAAMVRHLETAHRLTRETLAEARATIWAMRSQALERHGLAGAVEGILRQFAENTAVETDFRVDGTAVPLAPVVENELLRIGQEAIGNAFKHAAPRRVEVSLGFADGRVVLAVSDDGAGFDPAEVAKRAGRFGLLGMRERAAQIGARLEIDGAPGRGTRVTVSVPRPAD